MRRLGVFKDDSRKHLKNSVKFQALLLSLLLLWEEGRNI